MEPVPDEAELDAAHALARLRRSMFGRGPGGLAVSRYSLQERLGSGGEGAVYAAFDPELGRRVAIKLLPGGVADYEEHGRLVREARLLASISHPNVVTIYDAGEYDLDERGLGWGVFIVLELLEGMTLDRWIAAEPRSVAEIVDLFVEVGRGLQAVHDTGLVHRDVKPRNILVSDDGRVQLADFGIAYGSQDTQADAPRQTSGTPRFMAPEQRQGAAPDPRADQFSYCAALWAALYGRPPSPGESAPRASGVARRVRRALERGLSPDPAERFPAMRELVDRLDGARLVRQIAGGGAAGLALLGLGVAAGWEQPPSCGDAGALLSAAYSPSDGDGLEAALAEFDNVGPERAAKIRARLDGYTREWFAARQTACLETGASDAETRTRATRTLSCLDHALSSFDTVTTLLAHPDATVAANVDGVLHRFRTVQRCVEAPPNVPPVPEQSRPEIGAELIRVSLLTMTNRLDDAQAVLDGLDPATLPHGLAARWYGHRATLRSRRGDQQAAEADYSEALHRAHRAGDDAYVVSLQTDLMQVIGVESSRHVEAMRLAEDAQARAELANLGPRTRAALALTRANLASERGNSEQAETYLQQVLTLCADDSCGAVGGDLLAGARLGLGNIHLATGRYSQAAAAYAAHHRATLGTGGWLGKQAWMSAYNLGLVELDLGHFESAKRWVDRAEKVDARGSWRFDYARAQIAYREDDPDAMDRALEKASARLARDAPRSMWTVALQRATARSRLLRGERERASRELRSLHEQTEREFGPSSDRTIGALADLANAEYAVGAYAACLEHYSRVLEQRKANSRADHPEVALAEHGVGRCLVGLEQPDLAVPHLRAAHRTWEEQVGPLSPQLIEISLDLGAALSAAMESDAAYAVLADALALEPDTEAPPRHEARLLFAMAQLDRVDGVALAHRARDIYAALGARYARDVEAIDRFIDDRNFP